MSKGKKLINRERMYEKIMPSNLKTIVQEEKLADDKSLEKDTSITGLSSSADSIVIHAQEAHVTQSTPDAIYPETAPEEEGDNQLSVNEAPDEANGEMKEAPRTPCPPPLFLMNVMEDLVAQNIEKTMHQFKVCPCRRCRLDVTALALNKLKPKYVAQEKPALLELIRRENHTAVMSALIQACIAIKTNPRHDVQ